MEKKLLKIPKAEKQVQSFNQANARARVMIEGHYLTSWNCLQIQGPDTVDFLNRLLSIQVSSIQIQQSSWAFLLDHRGRVQECMYLLREDEQTFIAVSEMEIQTLHDALDRFLFAENLTLKILEEKCIYSHLLPNNRDLALLQSCFFHRLWSFPLLHGQYEYLSLGSKEQIAKFMDLNKSQELLTHSKFEHERIRLGIPQALREYKDRSPLDVSTQGISEGKGCYPGQEVIERTLALGKPAKRTLPVKIYASDADLSILTQSYFKQDKIEILNRAIEQDLEQAKTLGTLTSLSSCIIDEDQHQSDPFLCGIIQIKNRTEPLGDLILSFADGSSTGFRLTVTLQDP